MRLGARIRRCAYERPRGLKPAALRIFCLVLGSLSISALLPGCGQEQTPEPDFVRDEAVRGPLKLAVEVRPKQVWLGDPIEIAVRMHTPDGYVAQLPTADELGELEVRYEDAPDPRPAAEGGLDWRRTFTVETSYASGHDRNPPAR